MNTIINKNKVRMKFQVGQKVLCVNDHFNYGPSRLKKGNVYTIQDFYICPCGSFQLIVSEIPDVLSMRCKCNSTIIRRQSYYAWRFKPLENYDMPANRNKVFSDVVVS